jgi:outer membrane protein assembly factor BamB
MGLFAPLKFSINLFMECGGKASQTSGDTALARKHVGQTPVRVRPGEPKRRCHFILRRTPYGLPFSGAIILLTALGLNCAQAGNWPHWRGPSFNGATTEAGLPEKFSNTENVLWTAPMPGPAAATPIVWGNNVFISSVDRVKQALVAVCLDVSNGKVRWEHEIPGAISRDDRSNFASGSPTTDGKLVYFYYATGDLIAYDLEGKSAWARNIQKEYGPYAFQWTFSSSPTLYDGKLILQVLQRNVPVHGHGRTDGPIDSYLLGLDPASGNTLWKEIRPSDARQESFEAYSTPIPYSYNNRSEILVVGGDCVTGHDPANGHELWRWGTWNPTKIPHWRMVPSNVAGDGIILACAPKNAPIYAVKAGGEGKLGDAALAWVSKEREVSSDVSTPLFYKDRFYVLHSDRHVLLCLEPKTGKVIWTGQLGNAKFEASPTAAEDKIYMINQLGEVFVVAAGGEFKLLNTTPMGEEGDPFTRSSIAIAEGKLFIRTATKLFCVGKP